MKIRVSRLLFVALVILAASVPFASSQADASGPFRCQPGFYQVISGQLNLLNPLTGVYTPIGAQLSPYNAIGFNPVDNYIYGWGTDGNHNRNILRIDSSGAVTLMGNAGQTSGSFISADFDDEGFLWMRKNATTMVKVDVRTNPATSDVFTFTGDNTVGVNDDILFGADMGWIGDALYAVQDRKLMRADLNTQIVSHFTISPSTSFPTRGFPSSGTYGAVFSNRSDELYVSGNSDQADGGRIYRITGYNSGSPEATWVMDSRGTTNNDGAACKLAPSPFESPTATDDSYSTTNDQSLVVSGVGVFANDGASTPSISSNTLPSSGTLTMNADGSFTYTPVPGFVGIVTFTYTGVDQWGRAMPAATVTITVNIPAGTTSTATPSATPSPTTTIPPVVESLPASGFQIMAYPLMTGLLVIFGIALVRSARHRGYANAKTDPYK